MAGVKWGQEGFVIFFTSGVAFLPENSNRRRLKGNHRRPILPVHYGISTLPQTPKTIPVSRQYNWTRAYESTCPAPDFSPNRSSVREGLDPARGVAVK